MRDGWEWIGPGGRLHPEEFLERFYGHIIIEGLLAIIIGYLFFQSSFKSSGKTPKPLTEEASLFHEIFQGNCKGVNGPTACLAAPLSKNSSALMTVRLIFS